MLKQTYECTHSILCSPGSVISRSIDIVTVVLELVLAIPFSATHFLVSLSDFGFLIPSRDFPHDDDSAVTPVEEFTPTHGRTSSLTVRPDNIFIRDVVANSNYFSSEDFFAEAEDVFNSTAEDTDIVLASNEVCNTKDFSGMYFKN